MLGDLLRDAKFWAAVVALLNAVIFFVDPQFPKEIWAAIDALLAVVIGGLATRGAAEKAKVRRVMAAWTGKKS